MDSAKIYYDLVDINSASRLIGDHYLILDAGCGDGRVSIPLAKSGARVIGVDLSIEGVKVAHRSRERNCEFLVADFEYLPFKNDVFNLTLFIGSFEYIDEPEEVLKESHRVLRSGGKVLFIVRSRLGAKFRYLILDVPYRLARLLQKSKYRRVVSASQIRTPEHACYSLAKINEKISAFDSKFRLEKFCGHDFFLPRHISLYSKILRKVGINPLSLPRFFCNLNNRITSSAFGIYVSSSLKIIMRKVASRTFYKNP